MKASDFKIIPARRGDADSIADAVIAAVGEEITLNFAGSEQRVPLVKETFRRLAARDDSQYSYRNSLVALDDEGNVAGVIISYDGEELHYLRKAFISVANEVLSLNIKEEDMHDETSADEIYLDSLCVFPKYRGMGLAKRLIEAASLAHKDAGKPLGLLVDYDNPKARKLYVSLGFESVGKRPFAGTEMEHMQKGIQETRII